MPPDTLSGAVFLSGIILRDPAVNVRISKPIPDALVLLADDADPVALLKAHINFTELCFAKLPKDSAIEDDGADEPLTLGPTSPHWAAFCTWIGTALNPPVTGAQRRWAVTNPQDSAPLLALGASGQLPLLVLHGARDAIIFANPVVEELRPHFKSMDVRMVEEGGSHAFFHENPEETMAYLLEFAEKVFKTP